MLGNVEIENGLVERIASPLQLVAAVRHVRSGDRIVLVRDIVRVDDLGIDVNVDLLVCQSPSDCDSSTSSIGVERRGRGRAGCGRG